MASVDNDYHKVRDGQLGPGVPNARDDVNEYTPIPIDIDNEIPTAGQPPHMDIEATLRHLVAQNKFLRTQIEDRDRARDDTLQDVRETLSGLTLKPEQIEALRKANDDSNILLSVARYEKKIERAQKWGGWIWGVVGLVGIIFSAGVAYSVFMGANATDDEVEKAVNDAITQHNGGSAPATIDNATHEPIGDHPDMRRAIQANTEAVQSVKQDVGKIEATQRKLDKRSEYQFEFSRWQADVTEAERQRERPPKKPERLKDLERQLMLGDFAN